MHSFTSKTTTNILILASIIGGKHIEKNQDKNGQGEFKNAKYPKPCLGGILGNVN